MGQLDMRCIKDFAANEGGYELMVAGHQEVKRLTVVRFGNPDEPSEEIAWLPHARELRGTGPPSTNHERSLEKSR